MKPMLDRIAIFIATGAGSGFAPKAPGTVGSLLAIPLIWLVSILDASVAQLSLGFLFLTVVSFWAIAKTESLWQTHDDSRIVIDEILGMYVTLAWFPFDVLHVVLGFLFFRLFDIWKPGPIGYVDEHAPGAWGTLFDDVVAGFAAATCLWLVSHTWG